ncbi:hypothetical protein ACRE_001320 [Hapsidospora chrysogenum ATCC 11550]|uniref:Uncharacterized protein n=1 Tax=Hapsidospora chrysogenum (strain ATCC 11550 / CBS 779.69 / DSM 880 / IAM 14645 / JCM 23072 / IMI 49137) TaxID=857340 RepID=A0A086THK4_HAPC1|nr:hypothetical protein ACRE_001320 [Hapsidospora chrysogenum ATCC 11550]
MPKKDKKHAKENGGIAAAVTKQTAGRFSSTILPSTSNPASNESTPPINTPDTKPTVPDHVHSAPSPLLDALSNVSVSASTVPSMTNEWARPGALAGSPGNLISLMGESPPTQPSSYEDASGRLHHGWAAQRAFMSPSPASPSPPNSVRRPLSYQMEQQHQHLDSLPRSSPAGYRRSSLHAQMPQVRSSPIPPLPHQPQPHFYGVPDLDLTLTPQAGMKAGERGYYFGFDRMPTIPGNPRVLDNVVVAGYEGGLDVYSVSKKGLEPLGGLKGLHGGVIHAKILPWTVAADEQNVFPLVAIVLHAPVLPSRSPDKADQSAQASPRFDGAASPRSNFGPPDGYQGRHSTVDSYQTSVHVYSLKTNTLVDTLLSGPKIPISAAIALTSPAFTPPPPAGAFTIQADSGTVAVCSGATGECWIFLQLPQPQNTHIFACVGKLWTSLQHSHRGNAAEEGDNPHASAKPPRPSDSMPIFALNGRWIAYCPSAPSSQIALAAHVPVPILGRAPGVSSMTPPHLPAATSSVDLISDSFVNKIMRETTQELISGAKWVGQQGWQAFNSYWNKSSSTQPQPAARSPPASQFPPTHGSPGRPAPKEPGLVSIVDAEALAASSAVTPITSFLPPQGCSFLSFSPSSLALFTASSKGDVQNVWDLMRIHHTKPSPLQATISANESSGPLVRQIAHFSRMTVARIVDVAWAEPQGERLAMVTERGTVHLLEMPFSAFMWPPPRRRKPAQVQAPDTAETGSSAVSIATGAFGAAYQAAKPFVSRSRRGSASIPPGSSSTLKDSAAHGGRVIAAGISSSLGKTGTAINQFRHAGENRVTLPTSTSPPTASCVKWVRGRKSHSLYAIGDGLVRIFPNKARRPSVQSKRSRPGRNKDIKVPSLPDDVVAPAIRQIVDLGAQDEVLDLTDRDMEAGANTVTLNQAHQHLAHIDLSTDAAIPQAEIESSAPYQPFHTDKRVMLFAYHDGTADAHVDSLSVIMEGISLENRSSSDKKKKQKKKNQKPHSGPLEQGPARASAWAFGQDMDIVQVDLGLAQMLDEDGEGSDDQALPPSAMERVMEYGAQEQIVVTTRRRRSARHGDADGDGFFEDDCEVLDFADQRV